MNKIVVMAAIIALICMSGTCALCQARTTPVEVTNSPEVVVTNTPDVNVANSPMVRIDQSANQVTAAGRYQLFQFWTTDQVISAGEWLYGTPFNCAGFRELRFSIMANSALSTVKLLVQFQYPGGSYQTIGAGSFGGIGAPIAQGSEFNQYSYNCLLCMPAMTNVGRIIVVNDSTISVTIRKCSSVYMID